MSYTYHKLLSKSISHGGTRSTSSIKYIVLHYTGNTTDTAKANANYFSPNGGNTRKAGAHYFVDTDSVWQSIEDNKIAYAVGVNYGGKLFGTVTNANSISVEMCSQKGAIPQITVNNAAELTKKLMKKYNVDAAHVVTHYNVCAKQCPGWTGWCGNNTTKWQAFKKLLTSSTTTSDIQIKTTTARLNVRAGAGTDKDAIGLFNKGAQLKISKTELGWNRVTVWIPKKDTTIADGKATTKVETNMRSASGKSNPVIGTLDANVTRKVRSQTENWIAVYVWAANKYCK